MNFNFSGTGVALITPFRKQGTIDFSTLESVVESFVEAKEKIFNQKGVAEIKAGKISDIYKKANRQRFRNSRQQIAHSVGHGRKQYP